MAKAKDHDTKKDDAEKAGATEGLDDLFADELAKPKAEPKAPTKPKATKPKATSGSKSEPPAPSPGANDRRLDMPLDADRHTALRVAAAEMGTTTRAVVRAMLDELTESDSFRAKVAKRIKAGGYEGKRGRPAS